MERCLRDEPCEHEKMNIWLLGNLVIKKMCLLSEKKAIKLQ